ncbi:hypothetical protein [Paenibacillus sp. Soil766]|uniref:hypothetical protein n=1 Tax=Paenibacillus sp. Soil766 TaxID=1736404 RepID=UPI0012F8868B|nr:hypothetical protein [Paenibacillus sp. Soil766]
MLSGQRHIGKVFAHAAYSSGCMGKDVTTSVFAVLSNNRTAQAPYPKFVIWEPCS